MKSQVINFIVVFAICVGVPVSTFADNSEAPDELIRGLTNELISSLNEEGEAEKPGFYRTVVEETLGPFIDFHGISRRVMAKHYKKASNEQRTRFADSFKESLLNTYANGLSKLDDQKIDVLPFKGVQKKGKKERAKVDMEIRTSEGDAYPITYAIYRNNAGEWRLENIILNGVNLGLTFRNQFNESHRVHGGDIDKVIDAWSVKLATAKIDADKIKK